MYRVRWADTALSGLANLWTAAESALRDEITSASAQIDERLRRDPLGSSESRTSGRRILFQLRWPSYFASSQTRSRSRCCASG
jgi:hypothetical protein